MTSWIKPTDEQLNNALARLTQPSAQRHFFNKLENPLWVQPLFERGCFKKAPEPIRDKSRDTIQFPLWIELRWLAQMAKNSEIHNEVHKIVLQIPETDNIHAREDIVEIALSLPAQQSKDFVRFARGWLDDCYHSNIPELFGQLVIHLAEGGEVKAALKLCKEILQFKVKTRQYGPEDDLREIADIDSRFDNHRYGEIVNQLTEILPEIAGMQFFELLCKILNGIVKLSSKDETASFFDHSYIWRPAIEDHEQNQDYDKVSCALVRAIRDTGEYLIRDNEVRIEELTDFLELKRWPIFRRIALHFLRLFIEKARPVGTARVLSRDYFDEVDIRHEYILLLQETFPTFSPNDQKIFLSWVDEGPDKQEYIKFRTSWQGQAASKSQVEKYVKAWKRDHLTPIREFLPPGWKRQYEEFVTAVGLANHPEFPSYHGPVWMGPDSPESEETLGAMSVPHLVNYLKTWIPPSGPSVMKPSIRGLGRVLQSIASKKSTMYADEAVAFKGLNPTYVRSVLEGFTQALKNEKTFVWPPVLELTNWAVNQWQILPGDHRDEDIGDTHWGGVRKEAARLLEVALETRPGEIPPEHRGDAWNILIQVLKDPDPSQTLEKRHEDIVADAPTVAINSTRTEGVNAVVKYGLWIRRFEKQSNPTLADKDLSFVNMPEVESTLDERLDRSQEQSISVHSLFGRWFPWLALLDRSWAEKNIERIFPSHDRDEAHLWAAWESYILFCQPYKNIVQLLGLQYLTAVKAFATKKHKHSRPGDPQERAVEHLMILYLLDDLVTSELREAFETVFSNGPESFRNHALNFVGRNLAKTEKEFPPQVIDRAKTLWEKRLEFARKAGSPTAFSDELSAFEWWVTSPLLDFHWILENLEEALTLGASIDSDRYVVDRIAKDFEKSPLKSLECLEFLIDQKKDRWSLIGCEHPLEEILSRGMRSTESQIRDATKKLIHQLGRRGQIKYGKLLEAQFDAK